MNTVDPNLVRSLRLALVMLTNALPNAETGHVTDEDRRVWASGLEKLAHDLRTTDEHVVIPGEVQP